MATAIQNDTFQAEVLNADVPVLVDFWAPWCGPCRAVAPAVDELSSEYEGRARVVKVDVDQAPELAQRYGVSSIPAFVVFNGGEVKSNAVGALSKDKLAALIDAQLA